MPTYKGVEVWIEDSEKRRLNHEHVAIDLVIDNSVTLMAKTKMLRDELYTVHCRSPISVFCDVFVTSRSHVRQCAARFHLEKSRSTSDNVCGSSVDHMTDEYKDTGLRTSKRAYRHGKLSTVEVEIRRTGPIIEGEPMDECAADKDGQDRTVFSMIDDFDRPPWLLFVFDMSAKGSPQATAPAARQIAKQVPHKKHKKPGQTASARSRSTTSGRSNKTSCAVQNPPDIPRVASSLQQEYEKEEAEERRLLEILQERLEAKKMNNIELRRLLGETT